MDKCGNPGANASILDQGTNSMHHPREVTNYCDQSYPSNIEHIKIRTSHDRGLSSISPVQQTNQFPSPCSLMPGNLTYTISIPQSKIVKLNQPTHHYQPSYTNDSGPRTSSRGSKDNRCYNCGKEKTPRNHPIIKGARLCNACGLWFKNPDMIGLMLWLVY